MNMKKLTQNYIFDLLCAVILAVLGVLMIVLPDFGNTVLQYLVAAALLFYGIVYLIPEVKSAGGKIQILVIVELFLVVLVAIGLVISSLRILSLGSACQIFGVILWIRGLIDLCRSYLAHGTAGQKHYPFWRLLLSVLILSVGVYIFAKPVISDQTLVYIIAVLLLLLAIVLLYLMAKVLPKGKKAGKSAKKTADK